MQLLMNVCLIVASASGAYACTQATGVARVIVSVTSNCRLSPVFSNRIPSGIGTMVSSTTVTPLAETYGMFPSSGIVAVISFPNLICILFLLCICYFYSRIRSDGGLTKKKNSSYSV